MNKGKTTARIKQETMLQKRWIFVNDDDPFWEEKRDEMLIFRPKGEILLSLVNHEGGECLRVDPMCCKQGEWSLRSAA